MNTRKQGISATAALIAAGTLGIAASTASADPEVFDVFITTVGSNNVTEFRDFPGHQFGTTETVGGFFSITITSGPSDRQGWDYQVEIDYTAYDIGFFGTGTSTVELLGIKSPDSPFPIDNARAKDAQGNDIGSIEFDGGNIVWSGGTDVILETGEFVTIQWTQIPTPGAVALFGLAGLAAARRRR